MLSTILALTALQAAPATIEPEVRDTTPAVAVAPALLANAYLDPDAREMVRLARARREHVDSTIAEYRVLAKERISVGMRALRRDRVLFRREMAANIVWRREGTGLVQLLGVRQVVPMAVPRPHVPSRPAGEAADLAFDPSRELLLAGFHDGDLRHPLAPGSEAHYRFASGDTTRVRLAGGRVLRVAELRVAPRRPEALLLRGSLWLDLDTHSPVRGVFQLARPVDLVRDLEDEDDDDIPGILQPIEGDLRYLTVDYGLWEDRWWLPRLIALEGEGRVGRLLDVPVRFERTYEDYQVSGAGMPPLRLTAADSVGLVEEAEDSVEGRVRRTCHGERRCWSYRFARLPDTVLVASEHLPPSIYDEGAVLISEDELREVADVLGTAMPGGSRWHAPMTRISYLAPGLVRYNRVEGLALAARVEADLGEVEVDATAWLGAADVVPNGEIGVRRERFRAAERLAVYRRLAAVDPDDRALGFGSSLSAVVLGRDDSDYYRTLGAEITGAPISPGRVDYRWRLFAERQSPAEKRTDVSLPRLFSTGRTFHENISADAAEQVGVELSGRYRFGADPLGVRLALGAAVLAETGDYRFVRPSVTGLLGLPLPGGLAGAVEVAAGGAAGEVPAQALWYLGGPATVRGYGGPSRVAGEAFWRARGEVGSAFTAARVAVFSDAGWVGDPSAIDLDPVLLSAGVGASFLDGLLRLDLARALRGDSGWRLDLYFDGIL